MSSTSEALRPRPHQQAALTGLRRVLRAGSRAQLVMACGTGKTLVGRWHAEAIGARLVLVVLPSLALVSQTLAEWRHGAGSWAFEAVVVCSDPTTGDRDGDAHPGASAAVLGGDGSGGVRVSTDEVVVGRFLSGTPAGAPGPARRARVVFSTYHSLPVVAAACARAGVVLDLVVADEAHRLAGNPDPRFRTVLDEQTIPARQRVFMTATPVHVPAERRVTGADGWDDWSMSTSMADEAVFGPVAYRLGFAEAIAAGLLCDYQVLVIDAATASRDAGARSPTGPAAALLAATSRWGLRRVLSFHGRVSGARALAAAVDGTVVPGGRRVRAVAVSGADSAAQRAWVLDGLRDVAGGEAVVVTNARCLGEGVDVPAIDGIVFADPKSSQVDIVQAIGRVVRPAPGKTRGLVVVPVELTSGALDDDTALWTGPFAAVWAVLRALRQVDDRIGHDLDEAVREGARRGRLDGSRVLPGVVMDLPDDVDQDRLRLRMADVTGSGWEVFFGELLAHVDRVGSADPAPGGRLGLWCERQRKAFRGGRLPAERAARLEQLSGWVWDRSERLWLEQWAQVSAAAGVGVPPVDGQVAAERLHRRHQARSAPRTLGQWCAAQRIAQRAGALPAERRARCEQIPGWRWDVVPAADAAAVDLLQEWVAWKDDANPPPECVEDDIALGRWLSTQRRRRVVGTLSQALADEMWVVTAAATVPLRWQTSQVQWYLGLEAVRAFSARERHCRVPDGHLEALVDMVVPLYVWCRRQRHEHRAGRLDPARAAALASLPGWRWEVQPAPRVRMDIGDARHGTRTQPSRRRRT